MNDNYIQILLIEDDDGDVLLLREMLTEDVPSQFQLTQVERLALGIEQTKTNSYDVVLLDLSLPDAWGLDTFTQLHAQATNLPIIVLSGLNDESLASEAVQTGAQDYLVKGQFNYYVLTRAIRYAIERKRIEVALHQANETLEQRVSERTDELLQANRLLLDEIKKREAVEVHNTRLFEAEQRARQVAEILQAANLALTQTLELENVFETLLAFLEQLVPYNCANVMLHYDNDTVIIRAETGCNHNDTAPTRLHVGRNKVLSRLFLTQKSVFIADTLNDNHWVISLTRPGIRSWLGVPLVAGGKVIGLYSVGNEVPQFFTKADMRLAEALAAPAAVAVQNALLYDAERRQFQQLKQSQAQLIQAEKLSALGRLTASIAHEVNNPIQAMQGCLTLAQEALDEGDERETVNLYLDIVQKELLRVADIVQRMRDFYRPAEEGKQAVDVREVLQAVLELTGKQLQRSRVTVTRQDAKILPTVWANKGHLHQVFLNLILNAVDAMPDGGQLLITTIMNENRNDHATSPSSQVAVAFHNTGALIPPEAASHLFEPFFTTKAQGSGLGLAVSYGIIEAHHGQITVVSNEEVGTIFTVLLPAMPRY